CHRTAADFGSRRCRLRRPFEAAGDVAGDIHRVRRSRGRAGTFSSRARFYLAALHCGRRRRRGRITPPEAAAFGMTLAFFSVLTLGILVNWVAGGLLAFTIFFYVVIYTML